MSKPWATEKARDEFRALMRLIGSDAEIFVTLSLSRYETSKPSVHATVYPNGMVRGAAFTVHADDLEALHAAVSAKWAEFSDEHVRRTVRNMALEIIRITADLGACSDGALRQAGFSQAEIDKHGPSACADANEIAANGPFEIATTGRANAEAA